MLTNVALRWLIATAMTAATVGAGSARAEVLGVSLPSGTISASLTQGGPPNFADTFVTPYIASETGTVTSWRAQFLGGLFPAIPPSEGGPFEAGPGVPTGIQLKILRPVSPTILRVVAAGAVHDPRPTLQARLPGYPFFLTADSVMEFTEPGLELQPGDVIGLTIRSDPLIGRYLHPLIGVATTRLVLRDVPVGGTIDLADIFTVSLPWPPAVQVIVAPAVTSVRIDVKPGSSPNSVNLGSNGTIPVAIFSTPSFDATAVDPLSLTLASAPVKLRGRGMPMAGLVDVDGDGLLDLVVHVSTEALGLSDVDTESSSRARRSKAPRFEARTRSGSSPRSATLPVDGRSARRLSGEAFEPRDSALAARPGVSRSGRRAPRAWTASRPTRLGPPPVRVGIARDQGNRFTATIDADQPWTRAGSATSRSSRTSTMASRRSPTGFSS